MVFSITNRLRDTGMQRNEIFTEFRNLIQALDFKRKIRIKLN